MSWIIVISIGTQSQVKAQYGFDDIYITMALQDVSFNWASTSY